MLSQTREFSESVFSLCSSAAHNKKRKALQSESFISSTLKFEELRATGLGFQWRVKCRDCNETGPFPPPFVSAQLVIELSEGGLFDRSHRLTHCHLGIEFSYNTALKYLNLA